MPTGGEEYPTPGSEAMVSESWLTVAVPMTFQLPASWSKDQINVLAGRLDLIEIGER